jgi:hypothetical protein
MIGKMGRAEVLAAVALVVGARQEPVAAFRQLAAEDPALRRLGDVAMQLEAGQALPDALVSCRLLGKADAGRLAHLPPSLMADELTRSAQHAAWPPLGEILARWLPVWAALAATVPSLAIGAVVALVSGGLYGGVWYTLGFRTIIHGPAWMWFAQLTEAGTAVLIAAGCWWLLRRTPFLCRLTTFSYGLNKATAAAILVRSARAGLDIWPALNSWGTMVGEPAAVQDAIARSGGDATTTLIKLGLVPRKQNGQPDWDTALSEADSVRSRAAAALTPWLVAVLVPAGIIGFMTWEMAPLQSIMSLFGVFGIRFSLGDLLSTQELSILKNAGCAVLGAHVLLLVGWFGRLVSGPAHDWPLVGDRLARALDRREDLNHVIGGLRMVVDGPMRRRLNAALAYSGDPHPGSQIVKAGVVPRTQEWIVAHADGADLPTILRSAIQIPNDHGLRAATNQATALLTLAVMLTLIQLYLLIGVIPKLWYMVHYYADQRPIAILSEWAGLLTLFLLVLVACGGILAAWGARRGWWIASGGWTRLANGLVLRRMLSSGENESTLGRMLSSFLPLQASNISAAAHNGDLPGILSAAGWKARTPSELDRALATDLARRDRRRARLALAGRLLLPFIVGIPISMTAAAISLSIYGITAKLTDLASAHPNGTATLTGSTPGMALVFWWCRRCEEQGDTAVQQVHDDIHPEWIHVPQPKAPK